MAMLLVGAACGDDDDDDDASATETTETTATGDTTADTDGEDNLAAPDSGVSETEIVIGNIFPVSSPINTGNAEAQAAIYQKYFDDYVNSQGGIHGRTVKVISVDDAFDPNKGAQLVKKLVEEDNVLTIFAPVSTFTLQNVAPYVAEQGVTVISPDGYQPESYTSEWYFPTTNFFDVQGYKIGQYVTCELGFTKVGVWSTGSYDASKLGGDAMAKGVEECGGEVVNRFDAAFIEPDYTAPISGMRSEDPEVVISSMHPLANQQLFAAAQQQNWTPEGGFWFNSSTFSGEIFKTFGDFAQHANVDTEFGDTETAADNAEFIEFAEWAIDQDLTPDSRSIAQLYAGFEVLVAALEHAGGDLNRETFKAALEDMEPVELPGVVCEPIDYEKGPHAGNPCLRVMKYDVDEGKFVEVEPLAPAEDPGLR